MSSIIHRLLYFIGLSANKKVIKYVYVFIEIFCLIQKLGLHCHSIPFPVASEAGIHVPPLCSVDTIHVQTTYLKIPVCVPSKQAKFINKNYWKQKLSDKYIFYKQPSAGIIIYRLTSNYPRNWACRGF